MTPKTILIIGGGFAGVQAALRLNSAKLPHTTIRLVDPKSYFEYHAALYRFAAGKSPMETCLLYRDIFQGTNVEVVEDSIVDLKTEQKIAEGASGSRYRFDTLIVALGNATDTFGIPGITEHSFGMKSASEAARLKSHIEETHGGSIAIVGGGATGVELAGELASFTRCSCVHLIESSPRLLGNLSEQASAIALKRLTSLGVRVHANQKLVRVEENCVVLERETLHATTVVWTAGMRGHVLLEQAGTFSLDRKGRAEVDSTMRAKGHRDIFVLGDNASTRWSGMAQTALYDGAFAADVIIAEETGRKTPTYAPNAPIYAIPVGKNWAMIDTEHGVITGKRGWMQRRLLDFKVFRTFLPLRKAIAAFFA